MQSVINYIVIVSLVEIVIMCFLYKGSFSTKVKAINKHIYQTIVGLIVGLLIGINVVYVKIDFNELISFIYSALIIPTGILFGPWAGILAGVLGAIFRFFLAGQILNIAYDGAWIDSVFILVSSIVAAIVCQSGNKQKKPSILMSVIIILVLSVAHFFTYLIIQITNLWKLYRYMVGIFTASLPLNVLFVFILLVIYTIIYNMQKKMTIGQVLRQKKIFFGSNILSNFKALSLVFILLILIFKIVDFGVFVNEFARMDCAKKFEANITDLINVASRDAAQYGTSIEELLPEYANDVSNETTGVFYVVDNSTKRILNKTYGFADSAQEIAKTSFDKKENTCYGFQASLKNPRYLMFYKNYQNLRVIAVSDISYEYAQIYITLLVDTISEFVFLILLFFFVYLLIRNVVGKNLDKINNSLTRITRGNLGETVNAYEYDEFAELSNHINATVGTLKGYIDIEANRYSEEFELAKQIQTSALPNVFPPFPDNKEIDIFAKYQPAKQVGGDFYDYYFISPEKLVFLVADVSGKGIPAAMFMMRAKTAIRVFASEQQDAAKTLEAVNNHLCENNDAEMFVTCWLGIVDVKTGYMQHSSAGHNLPFLIKPSSENASELDTPRSLVLGGLENIKYKNAEYKFEKNEKLLLFTDGVTEANNPKNKLFGEERLQKTLTKNCKKDPNEICEEVFEDVYLFMNTSEQFDDITLLCFLYRGEDIRVSEGLYETEISVRSTTENVTKVTRRVLSVLDQSSFPDKYKNHISVAIDEIYSNIVKYGYKSEDKYVTVRVTIDERNQNKKNATIDFIDIAKRFNPLDESAPDTTLDAEERQIGGLGIFMVRQMMDDVFYEYENGVNCLTIVKYY